jgi:hypothetical protein
MSDSISFDELVARLPGGKFLGDNQPAFGIQPAVPTFVPPTLRLVDGTDEAAVTLISARGATGKTTLAVELSAVTQTPLWRLDTDLSVSADALESRLHKYIGPGDAVRRFAEDESAFVVVDALDEARMRVSGTSWTEYMESIAKVATTGRHFVLLGRERILEDVWLSLEDAGIGCDWWEISHFDRNQRVAYVDGRVGERGRAATDNEAYISARDAVLAALEGTVAGPLSDAFVGYAPVLDAVVALLLEGNLIAVENAFAAESGDGERISVLVHVLESLLEREQAKTDTLADQLGLEQELAYRPSEQLEWLASELLDADPPSLDWCPADRRADYATQIAEFLRDHPFRAETRWASPVFSAFVAAKRFGDPTIRRALRQIGDSTGLLFEFVAHDGSAVLIDEWQFAALHASLLSAEWQAVEAVVSIASEGSGSEDGDLVEQAKGELVLLAEGEVQRRAPFDLVLDRRGNLSIVGPTSFISVVFPATVRVSSGESSLALGPDCFIRCRDLYLDGDSVQVLRRAQSGHGGASDDASVVLEASRSFHCNAALSGNTSPEVFEIRVPEEQRLAYPWVAYRHDFEPSVARADERAERFLNMLMRLMRKHGRKELAVFDKKLEGRQSIKGAEFKDVLAHLETMGVLSVAGPMIYLNEEWAEQRFDGRGREGQPTLEDRIETWRPVLETITSVLR